MKIVVQRVKEANVKVEGKIVGSINKGFMVLVGITHTDTEKNQQKFPEMSPNVVICCILLWFESKGVLH